MEKILSILNNTSGERLFWYTVIIIVIISILGDIISDIIKSTKK